MLPAVSFEITVNDKKQDYFLFVCCVSPPANEVMLTMSRSIAIIGDISPTNAAVMISYTFPTFTKDLMQKPSLSLRQKSLKNRRKSGT